MASGAYQEAVDDCWQIFHNPMILLDASSKVLGITSHYQDNPPDAEWAYLMKYGYSSVQAVQYMKLHFPNRIFAQKAIRSFEFQGKMMNGRGIGCGIYQGEILIGRVTILEKERGINSGDYHVLKLFTDCFLDSVRKKEDAGESQAGEGKFFAAAVEPASRNRSGRILWAGDGFYGFVRESGRYLSCMPSRCYQSLGAGTEAQR